MALKFIASLEPGRDKAAAELWLDEAERRLATYDAGETGALDADEAIVEVERRLK